MGEFVAVPTVHAYDAADRHSQTVMSETIEPLLLIDSAIFTPTDGMLVTTTTPFNVEGYAAALYGVSNITVTVNGTIWRTHFYGGGITQDWTDLSPPLTYNPPGDGRYRFVSIARENYRPSGNREQTILHPITITVDSLPPTIPTFDQHRHHYSAPHRQRYARPHRQRDGHRRSTRCPRGPPPAGRSAGSEPPTMACSGASRGPRWKRTRTPRLHRHRQSQRHRRPRQPDHANDHLRYGSTGTRHPDACTLSYNRACRRKRSPSIPGRRSPIASTLKSNGRHPPTATACLATRPDGRPAPPTPPASRSNRTRQRVPTTPHS